MFRKLGLPSLLVALGLLYATQLVHAQSIDTDTGRHSRPRITRNIDEGERVTLAGNTHRDARVENDRGKVHDAFPMEHLLLQLRRSPAQEKAVQKFMEDLHNPNSPDFHKWLNADEFGDRFGVSDLDVDILTRWLRSHGFRINVVYPSGMVIDFSGTADQVNQAFGTEIHHLEVRGKKHIGNINNPQIPAALASVVVGVVSMHDFRPHTMHVMRSVPPKFTFSGLYGDTYAVVPADLATIYNFNPLFKAGYSGQGQTIALIEDTDVFTAADWSAFRAKFGLSSYTSGSFKTVHPASPTGPNNCARPGVVAPNDAEAILDAEWASAAAPSAAVEIASCADTTSTFGGLIAIQNLINASSRPPAIMSVSYGQCETVNGAAANAAYNSAYQQAAAEGVSVFVAAGDSGAAGCDNSVSEATHGVGANAFASTPYNVAVGGTDFSDTYSGTNGIYWNATNTSIFRSAASYIPEIPWNNSCAGALLSTYLGFGSTYGSNSLCNDPSYGLLLQTTVAGGGSPSACATGTPSIAGVVSGTCQGWPKPSWQRLVGNPNDGVRDTPDVSLFAADGLWSHYYVFCWSDIANGGAACSGDPSGWSGAGGTSFSAPILAGIQAIVNQKTRARQGNPNPVYYQLAAAEYGPSGSASCNSTNGNGVASSCVFYDVTQGDMDVNCTGANNCYNPAGPGAQGVLSTSNNSFNPAYGTQTGWDFATGIGTLNATNLVNNWPTGGPIPGFFLSASQSSMTLTQGSNAANTITINPLNGFSSSVTLSASGLPAGVTASFNPASATNTSTLTLTASTTAAIGVANVTITGTSSTLTSTTSISLTVNPKGNYSLSASPSSLTLFVNTAGTSTIAVTPLNGFTANVSLSASGLPSGVTASFNPASTASTSTLTLTAATAITGTFPVTITGTVGSVSSTATISLTVALPPTFSLSASPNSLSFAQGASGTSAVTVIPQSGFSGNVSLSASGLPSGVTASFNPASTTSTGTLTLTATGAATVGAANVTITGTSGSLTSSTTITLSVTPAPNPNIPSGWLDLDIGAVGLVGSASFANGVFTLNASGQWIYSTADGMHFVYQPVSGDATIVARVLSVQGGSVYNQAGVMIRETLDTGSSNAFTGYEAGPIYFFERPSSGASTSYQSSNVSVSLPYWVKLVRSGNNFSSYSSVDGVNWTQVGTTQAILMAANVYIGLAMSADYNTGLGTDTFDSVSVSSPAAPAPVISSVSATTGYVGSQVVISGSGFGASQGNSVVRLNGASATVNSWSDTSITITIPAAATSGPLLVSVDPSMNSSNPVTFTVTAPPNYTLSALPSGVTLVQGSSGTSTITVVPQNGFTGSVNLSASGLPSGVTASFNPSSTTSTSTLTLTASAAATTGTSAVTITGTSGSLSSTATLSLTITAAPSYSLSASPASMSIVQGTAGSSTITVAPQNGFTGSVNLSASGLPSGVTASFNPSSTTSTSTLTLTANATATTGTSTVTVTGGSGTLSSIANLSLTITLAPPAPSYSLSASPASVSVAQGAIGTSTITVVPQNGFTGSVNLSASGLPSGVTASFSPSSTTSTSTLTLTASATATTGTSTVTITGTSGGLTNATAISLTVTAPSTDLPSGWTDLDIGAVGLVGSASFTNGTFTLNASGQWIYSTADGMHFVYQPVSGDATIVARVLSVQGGSANNQAGVMIRETLDPGSSNAFAEYEGGPIYFFQRASSGGSTNYQSSNASVSLPYWVKLVRSGNNFSSYSSVDGVNWTQVGATQTIQMAANVYIGLAMSADNNTALGTDTFSNVSVSSATAPAPVISSTSATTGSIGGQVVMSGSGFGTSQGNSVVRLNGASVTVNSWSDTSITITIPTGATSGPLLVSVAPSMNSSNPITFTVTSQPLPSGWLDQEIGQLGVTGSASFTNGVFTLNASGQWIYSTADSMHFVYQAVSGDATIVARVLSVQGGSANNQAGVMIRETLDPGSSNAFAEYEGGPIYFFQRASSGGSTNYQSSNVSVSLPYWVKLVRSGNNFSSYSSVDGVNWTQVGTTQTILMAPNVYIGLAMSADNNTALGTDTFSNVSVTAP